MHRGEEERNKELSMGGVCMLTRTLSSINSQEQERMTIFSLLLKNRKEP